MSWILSNVLTKLLHKQPDFSILITDKKQRRAGCAGRFEQGKG